MYRVYKRLTELWDYKDEAKNGSGRPTKRNRDNFQVLPLDHLQGQFVQIHLNLNQDPKNKRVWTIKDIQEEQIGYNSGHDVIILTDVVFKIDNSQKNRSEREGKRNVHALVTGIVDQTYKVNKLKFSIEDDYQRVLYRPPRIVDAKTGKELLWRKGWYILDGQETVENHTEENAIPVSKADEVLLYRGKVYAKNVS